MERVGGIEFGEQPHGQESTQFRLGVGRGEQGKVGELAQPGQPCRMAGPQRQAGELVQRSDAVRSVRRGGHE